LPANHRRAPGHRRPQRRDAAGGDDVGQGRSGAAAGYRDVLPRFDRGTAAADRVRVVHARTTQTAAIDGSTGRIDEAITCGVSGSTHEGGDESIVSVFS